MSGNYTKGIQRILKISKEFSIKMGHTYVGSEHLMLAVVTDNSGKASSTLISLGCDLDSMETMIRENLKSSGTSSTISHLPLTRRAERILKNSFKESNKRSKNVANQNDLLLALSLEKDCLIAEVLKSSSIDYSIIKTFIDSKSSFKVIHKKNLTKDEKNSTLKTFTRNISDLASSGKLDPVIGRNNEIERLSQILSRRKKNNPVLIGEPGVGKTAIVEGLALRILQKKVPRMLWNYNIIAFDISGMLAGTKYRGQFEERMRKMMLELEKSKNIILFIDELHTIVGAGGTAGSLDAANMFKPSLARGDIQIIGATTLNEYRKYIEVDGALERRFQKIIVYQPSIKDTVNILNGIKDKYEKHHKVVLSKEAIESCVELSDKYINDRFLPDKAIDVMDEVCSRISLNNTNIPKGIVRLENELRRIKSEKNSEINNQKFENAAKLRDKEKKVIEKLNKLNFNYNLDESVLNYTQVTDIDVADTVSTITGIPISKINEKDSVKILNIKRYIKKSIIGQDYAIDKLVAAIQRSRSGFKNPEHPIGSFMFLGPTGVGKTELAKQLAVSLFDRDESLIKIDMSEYMERYNVSRLIGAPPGYVGYEEGGLLSEKVRRKPYSVVLFDEIEKAHRDVYNILLQILDEGRITDSLGRIIDFSNTDCISPYSWYDNGNNVIDENDYCYFDYNNDGIYSVAYEFEDVGNMIWDPHEPYYDVNENGVSDYMHHSAYVGISWSLTYQANEMINTNDNSVLDKREEAIIDQYPQGLTDIEKPKTDPVVLGDNVWIGKNAVILKGSEIASASVIGINAVLSNIKDQIPKTYVSNKPISF